MKLSQLLCFHEDVLKRTPLDPNHTKLSVQCLHCNRESPGIDLDYTPVAKAA